MSLLPGQILPPDIPLGKADEQGAVQINHDWWLLLYNLCANVLGINNSGLPSSALQELASADSDAADADAMALRLPLSNALLQAIQPQDVVISPNDLPDLARALLLAQDALPQDPQPRAQPAQSVAIGGSPFTYTAAFSGTVAITGGTVSAISLIRQGTSVATGITAGLFPLSRLDQLQITYSVAPTMTFLPA